jgi:integrase
MGEILSLQWCNVDMPNRVATLPDTKTGDARQVPLSTAAIAAISPPAQTFQGRSCILDVEAGRLSGKRMATRREISGYH